jgi:hypothetical protein
MSKIVQDGHERPEIIQNDLKILRLPKYRKILIFPSMIDNSKMVKVECTSV